ncbi:hypothetical protein [Botrimarina mediterranea]|uniref:hypothetical protein n=1 Tax=Botrimarina mediterranea TaxID=2528022 RepID=UPI00118C96B0|nr:hypothetical protein K2D_46640 [Planctomycetes bacterium K2D]
MQKLIESQITTSAFTDCWDANSPPYELFLTELAQKLSKDLAGSIQELSASIRPWGENRVRVDGDFTTDEGSKTFYAEFVWLSSLGAYRGKAEVRDKIPEPSPKSIDQFISAIDAIQDEDESTFEGQVFEATEGVDETSEDLPLSYASVFALFERFPGEDFGNPGPLVHMLEGRGGYENELANSLERKPSVPAVTLVNRILNGELPNVDRAHWMTALHDAATSDTAVAEVKDLAQELLEHQQENADDAH